MAEESKTLTFYKMVLGNTMDIDQEVLRRLSRRLQLSQVDSVDQCDVIIAFVPIVSRAGTDIESALQKIPRTGRHVVLAALHFTFDENCVAPQSRWHINRDDVFAVDLLCYEDLGVLRSLKNDEALKAVTDHLISIGGSPHPQLLGTTSSRRQCSPLLFLLIAFIIVILFAIAIGGIIYSKRWANHIVPTQQPNVTMNDNINSTMNSSMNNTMTSIMNSNITNTINSTMNGTASN